MISVVKELKDKLKKFNIQKGEIETLFIGGGTPTCIDALLYEDFFNTIKPYLSCRCEITSEANPNSLTIDWIQKMREFGVNRVSIGVQSFNEKKLNFLGRSHSKTDALKAINTLKESGIKNISIDLIYGTSLDTKALLKNDLEIAFSLPINHISSYSLTIEKGTKFFQSPQASNDDENMAFWFTKEIKKRGFKQYEISNFGLHKCRHNLGYWQYKNYIGIGCSAVGFVRDKRFYNSSNLEYYIKTPCYSKVEKLSIQDIKTEKVLLGARSIVGFDKEILDTLELKRANELVSEKKLIYKDGFFYNRDYFLSDEIALYILRDS